MKQGAMQTLASLPQIEPCIKRTLICTRQSTTRQIDSLKSFIDPNSQSLGLIVTVANIQYADSEFISLGFPAHLPMF
jgi:hypothetical protein